MVIAVPGSEVGHLPDWGSTWGPTLCHRWNVTAAVRAAIDVGHAVYVDPAGHRACRWCIARFLQDAERQTEQLRSMGWEPDDQTSTRTDAP